MQGPALRVWLHQGDSRTPLAPESLQRTPLTSPKSIDGDPQEFIKKNPEVFVSKEIVAIRLMHLNLAAALLVCMFSIGPRLCAQDDITTRNASSALGGGWITGPASNPLRSRRGSVDHAHGAKPPYDFPDFHPVSDLDACLPAWLDFGAEERFRYESGETSGHTDGDDD